MIKDIYILHVAGQIAFYKHSNKNPMYGFAPQDKFIDLIQSLRDEYPEYRLRCISNKGLEDWLYSRLMMQKLLKSKER